MTGKNGFKAIKLTGDSGSARGFSYEITDDRLQISITHWSPNDYESFGGMNEFQKVK